MPGQCKRPSVAWPVTHCSKPGSRACREIPAGKTCKQVIYPGVDHAFHNDTGQRYNAEQAQAAWAETLAWFEQYLRG